MLQNNNVLEIIQETQTSTYLKMYSDSVSIKWQSNHKCMTCNNNLNVAWSKKNLV
jgi:hypothetical protein